jgi:protein-tyrosine sulfotransferase
MEQIVFIGGMARSGINLLRTMLDSHSQIAAGPALSNMENIANLFVQLSQEFNNEGALSSYISEPEMTSVLQGFIEGMLLPYARRKGKSIAIESSANTLWAFPVLAQLFPTAKFIHVIRDGRDVACSSQKVAKRLESNGIVDSNNLGSALHTANMWRECVHLGHSICGPQTQLAREGRALEVRYEDLALSPLHELQRICRMLEVPFESSMLTPQLYQHDGAIDGIWITQESTSRSLSTDSVGSWLKELSFRDRMLFMAAGHEMLLSLGYERDVEWSFRDINISQEDAMLEIELVNEELALLLSNDAAAPAEQISAETPDASLKVEKVVVAEATAESSETPLASQLTPASPSPSPSSLPLRR